MRLFGILILTILFVSSSQLVRNETRSKGRINGQDAADGQFPYAVFVEAFYGRYYLECTGSLIGPEWVLTSAKCVDGMAYSIVYLGSMSRHTGAVAYLLNPTEIKINPCWNVGTGSCNLALIHVPKTDICYNIFPVPLPEIRFWQVPYEGDTAIASGWSKVGLNLQWVRGTVMTMQECATARGYAIDDYICSYAGPSHCSGDSLGWSLISQDVGRLIGIYSNSFKHNGICIAVYTRVSHYLLWIKDVTGISY